jgi:hypothetical protein
MKHFHYILLFLLTFISVDIFAAIPIQKNNKNTIQTKEKSELQLYAPQSNSLSISKEENSSYSSLGANVDGNIFGMLSILLGVGSVLLLILGILATIFSVLALVLSLGAIILGALGLVFDDSKKYAILGLSLGLAVLLILSIFRL